MNEIIKKIVTLQKYKINLLTNNYNDIVLPIYTGQEWDGLNNGLISTFKLPEVNVLSSPGWKAAKRKRDLANTIKQGKEEAKKRLQDESTLSNETIQVNKYYRKISRYRQKPYPQMENNRFSQTWNKRASIP